MKKISNIIGEKINAETIPMWQYFMHQNDNQYHSFLRETTFKDIYHKAMITKHIDQEFIIIYPREMKIWMKIPKPFHNQNSVVWMIFDPVNETVRLRFHESRKNNPEHNDECFSWNTPITSSNGIPDQWAPKYDFPVRYIAHRIMRNPVPQD